MQHSRAGCRARADTAPHPSAAAATPLLPDTTRLEAAAGCARRARPGALLPLGRCIVADGCKAVHDALCLGATLSSCATLQAQPGMLQLIAAS